MVTFWAYLRFQLLLWALRAAWRVLRWLVTAAILIAAAPITLVAAVAYRGRVAARLAPRQAVARRRLVAAHDRRLPGRPGVTAPAPGAAWPTRRSTTGSTPGTWPRHGHVLAAFVLCAPVAVPAALCAAGTAWAWRIYAIETGITGRTATAPVVFDARQWRRQARTARARITAPGTVPLTDRRGRVVMGATIRAVGHRWHPAATVPHTAMGRHQVVIGASGSGKTNLMMRTWAGWYAAARHAHLSPGAARPLLLVLDCKGGPDSRAKAARTRRLLHATGRPGGGLAG